MKSHGTKGIKIKDKCQGGYICKTLPMEISEKESVNQDSFPAIISDKKKFM